MRVRGTDRAWAAFFAAVSNQSAAGLGRRHVTDLRDDAVLSEASDGGGGGSMASSAFNVASTKAIVAADPTDDRLLASRGSSVKPGASTAGDATSTEGNAADAEKAAASSCGCCGGPGVAAGVTLFVSLNGGNSSEGAGVLTT